jgi:hypothetical protein
LAILFVLMRAAAGCCAQAFASTLLCQRFLKQFERRSSECVHVANAVGTTGIHRSRRI